MGGVSELARENGRQPSSFVVPRPGHLRSAILNIEARREWSLSINTR